MLMLTGAHREWRALKRNHLQEDGLARQWPRVVSQCRSSRASDSSAPSEASAHQARREVLSYIQKMVNQFSCGVADIIANDQTLLNVEKTLKQAKNEVRNILADAQRGKLETQPGKTMYQSFEARVNQRLNAAREDAGNIGGSSLDERNNIISMVNAGSKGSPLNIAQIVACVGQQNVEGARIRLAGAKVLQDRLYGFNDRTLPHFTKDDYGAEARGFVENSYLAGLTPQEVWMHAMGGREGVIDTACKTSETGCVGDEVSNE
ncbi:DNA-directed RNA polymerase II subunit RPB1 (RNA polymerase II subunit B1) (DNA-directed RNA polymerase III largest subunit) [Durusdinium trenchii]|uniref:DNA-directed RNA polymerase n=1 Tax=Durusdinium trenchii TaxID=1381693 RepID=A0ABP0N3W9_9DINO